MKADASFQDINTGNNTLTRAGRLKTNGRFQGIMGERGLAETPDSHNLISLKSLCFLPKTHWPALGFKRPLDSETKLQKYHVHTILF